MIKTGEQQYLELCQRIVDEGHMVINKRTGKGCQTVINADFTYDCRDGKIPLVTTRKSPIKLLLGEKISYIRGFDNAADFRKLGCKSWDANANENESWLNNLHRKGTDDLGRVYGVQGRNWKRAPTDSEYALLEKHMADGDMIAAQKIIDTIKDDDLDQLAKVVKNLSNGIDDRGETITYWNPTEFDQGCLRPCMHTYTFSILDGTLYLTAFQRSIDVPLGLVANMCQVVVFLRVMAQITGLKPGIAYHKMINAHIYENQLDLMKNVQLKREPFPEPTLVINPKIKSLEDLETWVTPDDFEIVDYEHHEPIKYPFSV